MNSTTDNLGIGTWIIQGLKVGALESESLGWVLTLSLTLCKLLNSKLQLFIDKMETYHIRWLWDLRGETSVMSLASACPIVSPQYRVAAIIIRVLSALLHLQNHSSIFRNASTLGERNELLHSNGLLASISSVLCLATAQQSQSMN